MTARFDPPYPPRGPGPVPVWRGFFGERARNAVYGWSRQAFEVPHIRRNVLGYTVHVVSDPDAIQHVLLDNVANYVKPGIIKRLLAPTIGNGLLTAEGSLWREQRKIAAGSFAPASVDALTPFFTAAARAAMDGWDATLPTDMAAVATATTMRVISDSLFAGDPRLTSAESTRHIAAAMEGISEARWQLLLGLPIIPLSRRSWAGRRGQIFLRRTLTELVDERIAEGRGDFLSLLVEALHERFPAAEARSLAVDNAATFYLAGHETTANTLTWTLFLLSEQQELQDQAAQEARAALSLGEEDAALPDRLPLLRRVIEESIRLYPPAPRFDREAVAADRLGPEEVRPGDLVSIWPWILHRHRKLWEDPDSFDADRWTPEARADRHRYQYIPFGAGPRICVGMRLAFSEALTVLAHWLSHWRFSPLPGRQVHPGGLVTLRAVGGLPLRLSSRD